MINNTNMPFYIYTSIFLHIKALSNFFQLSYQAIITLKMEIWKKLMSLRKKTEITEIEITEKTK